MKTRKLTMLSIFTGCGSSQHTIFLWVDYINGQLDFDNAIEEVKRVKPWFHPRLGDYISG
jgi:hypothetical protein